MKEEKKSTVYFLVGVPGSGKSTWAAKSGLTVLSSDSVRLETSKDGTFATALPASEIFRILDERAKQKLSHGEDFVFDASNIEIRFRRMRLNEWKRHFGATIHAVVCLVPKSILLERNRCRAEIVPEEIVEKIWDEFVHDPIDTSKDEFDSVSMVDEHGYKRLLFERHCDNESVRDIILSPVEFRQK